MALRVRTHSNISSTITTREIAIANDILLNMPCIEKDLQIGLRLVFKIKSMNYILERQKSFIIKIPKPIDFSLYQTAGICSISKYLIPHVYLKNKNLKTTTDEKQIPRVRSQTGWLAPP